MKTIFNAARPTQSLTRQSRKLPTMLVCICNGVSDRRITEEIRRGACNLRQIQDGCQAGTDCKSCVRQIRQMLATHAPARQATESSS